ncbi:TetR/AcrR family transcriptional regulator [Bacillaceae bacterium SIJ1]|uniref:TetR/AcrR family transcriptional regulator n=1 Tax=Litoribacterium kuwaitense TaxID=1398745 RepID=UPI0013EC34E2|nr:TetR/AcrR family transcriptional regulator [Litoribacterium kuwaitense]NGP43947.1 TetR/AcrR family transcriptional regulator [Litoribacterium kuwaitense]
MNEKKKRIIESALSLVGEKGFHATSMQDIAKKSGMSKGALYLHFSSKDELNVAMHTYYHERFHEMVVNISADPSLTPKERLIKQIESLFLMLEEHKAALHVFIQDNLLLAQGTKAIRFIEKEKCESAEWLIAAVKSIVPAEAEKYAYDISNFVEAYLLSYIKMLLIERFDVKPTEFAHYVMRRIDDVVAGLLQRDEMVLQDVQAAQLKVGVKSVHHELSDLETEIEKSQLDKDKKAELHVMLDVLTHELNKDAPQKIVFQGMLSTLDEYPEFKDNQSRILAMVERMLSMKEKEKTDEKST